MPSCRRFASLLPNATRPQRNLTKKTAASYARVLASYAESASAAAAESNGSLARSA